MTPTRADRARRRPGISLTEVLVCVVIFVLALLPLIGLFSQTGRVGFSARRLLDVSLHAQVLLEATAQLGAGELPPLDREQTILLDSAGQASSGGGGRWPRLVQFFGAPAPKGVLRRRVTAERLAGGEVLIRVEVDYLAVGTDARTKQQLTLHAVATPRAWRDPAP